MKVDLETDGNALRIGTPTEIFRTQEAASYIADWDLASDGRLLLTTNPQAFGDDEAGQPNVVKLAFNWLEELERLLVGQ